MSFGQWIKVQDGLDFYVGHDKATCPIYGLPNTVGWEAIRGCIDETTSIPLYSPACVQFCYADRIATDLSKQVARTLRTNYDTLQTIAAKYGAWGLLILFDRVVGTFVEQYEIQNRRHVKRQRKAGITNPKPLPLVFRWTWSGEVFRREIAEAMADIMRWYPAVTFFVYTKAIPHLGPLLGVSNLRIMLSRDESNHDKMTAFRDTLLAETGTFVPFFTAYEKNGTYQPYARAQCQKIVNKAHFPLARKAGDIGPCIGCGLCWKGKPVDIGVPIHR